jgi:hypothetical protein
MYQVPRKTYRDFHADLYPDTPGFKTELIPEEWQKGKNFDVPKISLDPAQRENGDQPMVVSTIFLMKLNPFKDMFNLHQTAEN